VKESPNIQRIGILLLVLILVVLILSIATKKTAPVQEKRPSCVSHDTAWLNATQNQEPTACEHVADTVWKIHCYAFTMHDSVKCEQLGNPEQKLLCLALAQSKCDMMPEPALCMALISKETSQCLRIQDNGIKLECLNRLGASYEQIVAALPKQICAEYD